MYCEGHHHRANRYIFGGILREGRWSASAAAKVFIVWHAMCYASCRPSLKTRSRPAAAAAGVMCDVMEPTPRPDLRGCRGWLLLGEWIYIAAVILLYAGIRDAWKGITKHWQAVVVPCQVGKIVNMIRSEISGYWVLVMFRAHVSQHSSFGIMSS